MRTEARPAGYPAGYETALRLDDGRHVTVRPILPSDATELADAIRTADADTLRARFLGGPPPITDAILDELTKVDYVSRFALVARAGRRRNGQGVGIARYAALQSEADGTPVAEVAVVVAPGWRGVGLATELLRMLAARAAECGITTFTALFMAENRPVVELAHEAHARVEVSDGAARLFVPLDDASLDDASLDEPLDATEEPAGQP